MKRETIAYTLALILLSGCGTNPDKPVAEDQVIGNSLGLPDWVVNPQIENGLADVACVPWSGHLTIDRSQASAMARNALVHQIELKAASMTKTFTHKTDTIAGSNIGADFEETARQLAEANLKGSRASRADLVTIDGKKQFCAMVTMPPAQTEALYQQLTRSGGATLSAEDDRVMFEQFKAYKAQQQLEQALQQEKNR